MYFTVYHDKKNILQERITVAFRLFTFYCGRQGPPRAGRAVEAHAMCPALEANRKRREGDREGGRQAASE